MQRGGLHFRHAIWFFFSKYSLLGTLQHFDENYVLLKNLKVPFEKIILKQSSDSNAVQVPAEVDGPGDGCDGADAPRGHALHHRVLVPGPPRPPLGGVPPHRGPQGLVHRPRLPLHCLLHGHETPGPNILPQKENMAAI